MCPGGFALAFETGDPQVGRNEKLGSNCAPHFEQRAILPERTACLPISQTRCHHDTYLVAALMVQGYAPAEGPLTLLDCRHTY